MERVRCERLSRDLQRKESMPSPPTLLVVLVDLVRKGVTALHSNEKLQVLSKSSIQHGWWWQ